MRAKKVIPIVKNAAGFFFTTLDHVPWPSPNHGPRPPGAFPCFLVLHYTGMATMEEARARLSDPEAQVSAHYLVDASNDISHNPQRPCTIYAMVPEDRSAWHAGRPSAWRQSQDIPGCHQSINGCSIGIEIVHPGHAGGCPPYPPSQIDTVIALCQDILRRHPAILPTHVVGHSDVAPTRKEDPGEHFPWATLARHGIGIWPPTTSTSWQSETLPSDPSEGLSWLNMAPLLSSIGYPLPTKTPDPQKKDNPHQNHLHVDDQNPVAWDVGDENGLKSVLIAFQRRFMPECIDGQLTHETLARARAVAAAFA